MMLDCIYNCYAFVKAAFIINVNDLDTPVPRVPFRGKTSHVNPFHQEPESDEEDEVDKVVGEDYKDQELDPVGDDAYDMCDDVEEPEPFERDAIMINKSDVWAQPPSIFTTLIAKQSLLEWGFAEKDLPLRCKVL
jgi:hypothetical protein